MQVRYLLLQTHYRTQLNFTFDGLDGAVQTLVRLSDFILRLQDIRREGALSKTPGFVLPILEKTMEQFVASLADDLNISPALAALFDMVRQVNGLCDRGEIGIL